MCNAESQSTLLNYYRHHYYELVVAWVLYFMTSQYQEQEMGRLNGTEPSFMLIITPVILSAVKMSSVKKVN